MAITYSFIKAYFADNKDQQRFIFHIQEQLIKNIDELDGVTNLKFDDMIDRFIDFQSSKIGSTNAYKVYQEKCTNLIAKLESILKQLLVNY